jgi:hypothetical protein
MSPKKKNQVTGLHPGPYKVGPEKQADLPVVAESADGSTTVVGRFPFSRQIDAHAQATAYAALPALVAALQGFLLQYPDLGNDEHISGADMIDFATKWADTARAALALAGITA